MFDAETIQSIIQWGGILLVALIVFAESGLLIGIILPGDSLLLVAGLLASRNDNLNIYLLVISIIIAAIIGYEVGYRFGQRLGPKVFKRQDGFLFREEYLGRTQHFFNKYGPVTVLIARFVAHVRTLVSVIAGASNMDHKKYTVYNIIGAIIWGGGLTLFAYWLGNKVPDVDKYIGIAVIGTLIVLYVFTIWKLARTPQQRRKIKDGLKADWQYFFSNKKS